MSSISSANVSATHELSSLAGSTNMAKLERAIGLDSLTSPVSSTVVTIPSAQNASDLSVYTSAGTLLTGLPPTWETDSDDPVTLQMQNDYTAQTLAGRFSGLGSALLDRFGTSDGDFTQSVSAAPTAGVAEIGTQAINGTVDLTLRTTSGITVNIELTSQNGSLSVSIKSSGKLSDSERGAISKLAGGFQEAIDGLSAQPPQIDLSGLTQFDTTVLSSVKFQYHITGASSANMSASYSQDGASRSLSVSNASGTLNIKLDTSNAAIWGTDEQRAAAVAAYLQQFDNANARGHGDESLMSMFKDGFAQLNNVDGTVPPQALPGTANTPWLQQSEQAMLSGLGDFSASVEDTPTSPNPLNPDETDSFAYSVSQDTTFTRTDSTDAISQHQHAYLHASYHQALSGSGKPKLTSSMSSQDYKYIVVNDAADSAVQIKTKDGALIDATLNQSSNDQTRVLRYENGQVISDTTTPDKTTSSKDLAALLEPLIKRGAAKHDTLEWQQALSEIHGEVQTHFDEQA